MRISVKYLKLPFFFIFFYFFKIESNRKKLKKDLYKIYLKVMKHYLNYDVGVFYRIFPEQQKLLICLKFMR